MVGFTGAITTKRSMARIINLRTGAKYDTYIGRPSIWGNPFSHETGTLAEYKVNSREEVVEKYEEWILTQPQLLAQLPELKDKTLACWCVPALCHGHVLLKLLCY